MPSAEVEHDVVAPRDGESADGVDAGEHADHEDLAVREVDHAEHAVDHGVAERDQRVDRAARDAVDQDFGQGRAGTHRLSEDLSRFRSLTATLLRDALGRSRGHGSPRDLRHGLSGTPEICRP